MTYQRGHSLREGAYGMLSRMNRENLAHWFEGRRGALDALARRIVGSHADAQDIVQDAWLKAATALDASVLSPDASMTTAVRNLALDHLRHRRVATLFAEDIEHDRLVPSAEEALTRRLASASLVLRIVRALDRDEAIALILHVVFDEDHAMLGDRLGKPSGAMQVVLHCARRRVRESPARALKSAQWRDVEAAFAVCWQAIEQCDPALLHAALTETIEAPAVAQTHLGVAPPVRMAMVLMAGRYVLALRQGGNLICVLPIGMENDLASSLLDQR